MVPPSKSKVKTKAKHALLSNLYEALEGKTGNPSTPQEFDDTNPQPGEVYFKASDEADDTTIKRTHLLNFIHRELHHATERKVPALTGEELEHDLEIYHRATYLGQEVDVCVLFGGRDDAGHKTCLALVKLAADGMNDESQFVYADASWTGHAKADNFGPKQAKMKNNYWTPRWKYLVNILRSEMAERYSIEGVYNPPPEPIKDNDEEVTGLSGSSVTVDEVEVFAGCTGKIIGPKGAEINKIRSESGCKNIEMPEKTEERPKARTLVTIKLSGTARQNAKAKKLIIAIHDEWSNAPRPARDRGGGGTSNFHGAGTLDFHSGGGDFNGGGHAEDSAPAGDWKSARVAGGGDEGGDWGGANNSAPAQPADSW